MAPLHLFLCNVACKGTQIPVNSVTGNGPAGVVSRARDWAGAMPRPGLAQNAGMASTPSHPSATPARHLIGDRVASAKSKTEKVQEEIELAEAELNLANLVITDKLADSVSDADLARAVAHNEMVEEKLHNAGNDLKLVTELLASEEQDRIKLEQSLRASREADGTAAPGSRTGEGSASVIEHLRELTRHKINTDHAEPARPATGLTSRRSRPAPRSK